MRRVIEVFKETSFAFVPIIGTPPLKGNNFPDYNNEEAVVTALSIRDFLSLFTGVHRNNNINKNIDAKEKISITDTDISSNLVSVSKYDSIKDAIDIMINRGIRNIGIKNQNSDLIGVINERTILEFLLRPRWRLKEIIDSIKQDSETSNNESTQINIKEVIADSNHSNDDIGRIPSINSIINDFSIIVIVITFASNNSFSAPPFSYAQQQEDQYQKGQLQYSFVNKWDSVGSGDGQLKNPHSIDVDPFGYVYVADSGNNRIQKFTADGKFITKWGSEGAENGQFKGLHEVSVDPSGKFVYTVELGNHRIQKFTADGKFITKWGYEQTGGRGALRNPHQIAVDSSGNLYLPDKGGSEVLKFDSNGKLVTKWGSEGTDNSQFKTPHGVAIDSKDNIYITDMDNFRVQKFDNKGNFITKWRSEGLGDGQFSQVTPGIDIDYPFDYVYIIDKENSVVQKFTADGKFITKWRSEGNNDGQFKMPEDIAVNSKTGDVYITDTGNSRIQVFSIVK